MFKPINEAHAIAETIVFFEFEPDLTPVMPGLLGLKEVLKDKFPRSDVTQEIRMEVGPHGSNIKHLPSGLQLSRFRTNGAPEWMVNIGAPAISFHCLDYSRWDPIWAEMKGYIEAVFQEMGAAPVSINAVGLKYVDRFIWSGDPTKYDAKQLFNKSSKALHGRAFESGSRWHCHSGWFDAHQELGEVLNQLNVDSGHGIMDGLPAVIVSIDHTQTLRRQREGALDQFGKIAGEDVPLDGLMKELHDGNKNVLIDLLSKPMAKAINLKGSNK